MAKNIEPRLKKIGEYLRLDDELVFVVPEYQRAYSWEIRQCDKLWQDLELFMESGGTDPYFFGTIIISCHDNDTKFSLIDGQQRTTTFLLLLKALLIRFNGAIVDIENDEDSRGLRKALVMKRDRVIKILYKAKDEKIDDIVENFHPECLHDVVFNHSINELHKTELNKILFSYDFAEAETNVKKIKYKQKDNKYTNYFRNFKFFYSKFCELSASKINNFAEYILDKSEIIEIRSWNVEQAITMFNSLNSDGMPLLDADIISAKLYSNSGADREDFNAKWAELKIQVSELDQKRIVNLDAVLMQYMYIKRALDKEYISETGAVSVTTPGLRRYYTDENRALLEDPLALTAQLLKIAKIWDIVSEYPIVQLCFKFNENIKLYLISYLYRFEIDEISENRAEKFIQHLLKLFIILELVDIGYSSSKFKSFLFGLSIMLVDNGVSREEIVKEIDAHIVANWNKEDLSESVLEYGKNALVYLDEFISSRDANKKFFLPEKYDIEHIMPRSGKNIDQIRLDAGLTDKAEFLDVVNRIGNKILLEENINRSLSNAWFKTKTQCSVKDKKGYKDSQFLSPNVIVDSYREGTLEAWTVKEINERTKEVAQRITDFCFSTFEE